MLSRRQKNSQLRLLMLAYLAFFPGTEGKGGKSRVPGDEDYYPGTRLRAPHMPLYERTKGERKAHFNALIKVGFLREEIIDEVSHYFVTTQGMQFLMGRKGRLIQCTSWYKFPGSGITWADTIYYFREPEEFKAALAKYRTPGSNWGVDLNHIYEWEEALHANA